VQDKNETVVTVAQFVRERRKANNLTQVDLALLAGVGRRFVSELENSKPSLQIDKVDAILRVFGMQLGVIPRQKPDSNTGGGS
jgi:y4mF family transcriptional regulator